MRKRRGQLALVAAAATLGLAALGAVLFLDANEAETTPVLTNNARSLDAFCEPAEKLLKAFRITEFNSHALNHHLLSITSARSPHRTVVMTRHTSTSRREPIRL
jgi:hypothetical protein